MCWQTAASTTSGRRITVDFREVDFVDDAGRLLLERMHESGARLTAATPVMREMVRQITGEAPVSQQPPSRKSRGLASLASRTGLALLLLYSAGLAYGSAPDAARAVLDRYLDANSGVGAHESATQLEIHASLPKMGRSGVLQALEYIPRQGRALFRVTRFDGDAMVKRQVIVRYLNAESEAHQKDDGSLALSNANYRFRYQGTGDYLGRLAWIWQVEPRARRVGLFAGELWLDADTARPLRQWGQFVKNPSVFIKQASFVRDYDIASGAPRRLILNLDAVFAGAAELTIWYHPVAEGPTALAAFKGDTGENSRTPVAERADALIQTDSGSDAGSL
jgi:hypothetical protein